MRSQRSNECLPQEPLNPPLQPTPVSSPSSPAPQGKLPEGLSSPTTMDIAHQDRMQAALQPLVAPRRPQPKQMAMLPSTGVGGSTSTTQPIPIPQQGPCGSQPQSDGVTTAPYPGEEAIAQQANGTQRASASYPCSPAALLGGRLYGEDSSDRGIFEIAKRKSRVDDLD